jgi:hypothetical protein
MYYRQQANGGEMEAHNRTFYTKDIFCKQKTATQQISIALVSHQQRESCVVHIQGGTGGCKDHRL